MTDNTESLSLLFNLLEKKRVFFIGFGNVDRADDAFGILFTRKLKEIGYALSINEVDDNIDNFIINLINRESSIDVVVFVDAVDFGGNPYDLILIKGTHINDFFDISVHKVPLSLYSKLLTRRGIMVYILGMQPKTLEPFMKYSNEIEYHVQRIIDKIKKVLLKLK